MCFGVGGLCGDFTTPSDSSSSLAMSADLLALLCAMVIIVLIATTASAMEGK